MEPSMGVEMGLIAAMMLLTAATHTLGLRGLDGAGSRLRWKGTSALLATVLTLLALHVLQILEYGALYVATGAVKDFETAVYFSGAMYSTIGSTEVELPYKWRLIGSLEGVNGLVMIGWSTAYLFAAWRHGLAPKSRD